MNAVALSCRGRRPRLVQRIGELQYARAMNYLVVANGDIRDPAKRTGIVLVSRRQQNGEARLTKTAPDVFQHIALE